MLCRDVLQIIITFLCAYDQFNMHSSCEDFYKLNIIYADSVYWTDKILAQDKYIKFEKLNVYHIRTY